MKKIYIAIICFVFLLPLLVGCTNKAYEEEMEKGLAALKDEKYANAEVYFTEALEEKEDDEEATVFLKQTKDIQEALKKLAEGELKVATSFIEQIISVENGSDILVERAKTLQKEIDHLTEKNKQYRKLYKQAKKAYDDGKFTESLDTIKGILEEDLSHPYLLKLQEDTEALKTEVNDARAKAEEKKEREEAERKEAERKEQERKEAEEKAANSLGNMTGYWLTDIKDMACHITDTYYACAVRQSDVMFQEQIIKINTISDTKKEITTSDGSTAIFTLIEPNVLQTYGDTLYRVSQEEANAIYEGYYELP